MGFNFLHSAIISLALFAILSVNHALILPALESDDPELSAQLAAYLLPPLHLTPDEKFAACCHEQQIREDLVEVACKYPPGSLTIPQQRELGKVLPAYVGCYAAHKNNRDCCRDDAGCRGLFSVCQDLCDGVNPPTASFKYAICGSKKEGIAACNKAAWGPDHLLLDELKPLLGESSKEVGSSLNLNHLLGGAAFEPKCCSSHCGDDCQFCDGCKCCNYPPKNDKPVYKRAPDFEPKCCSDHCGKDCQFCDGCKCCNLVFTKSSKSHHKTPMKHKQQRQLLVLTAEEEDQPQPQEKPEFVPYLPLLTPEPVPCRKCLFRGHLVCCDVFLYTHALKLQEQQQQQVQERVLLANLMELQPQQGPPKTPFCCPMRDCDPDHCTCCTDA